MFFYILHIETHTYTYWNYLWNLHRHPWFTTPPVPITSIRLIARWFFYKYIISANRARFVFGTAILVNNHNKITLEKVSIVNLPSFPLYLHDSLKRHKLVDTDDKILVNLLYYFMYVWLYWLYNNYYLLGTYLYT